MQFTDPPQKAMQIALSAVEEMRKRGIAPNPQNFTVWYTYAAGRMPDLNRAIDVHERKQDAVGETECAEVFDRFFSTAEQEAELVETSEKLSDHMDSVIGSISSATDHADAYGQSLDAAMASLSEIDGADAAKTTIGRALGDTRDMVEKNRRLESELKVSSAEVARLRNDLETLRKEAFTDGLTGISNRKKFDQTLTFETTMAVDTGEPLSLLMLDIDHFKKFNDTHGHQVGDQVLRLLATTLRENVKGQDTAARYGGEEFAIVLPRTALKDAATLAEQVRRAIGSKSVRNRDTGADLGRVTISIGVAQFRPGEDVHALIERADAALYAAKRAGRDRVRCEDDAEPRKRAART